MSGTVYIVATPIGNLEDITARALRILKTVGLIAAEDTRVTRKLLNHFEIITPITSFHQHTGRGKIDELVRRVDEGLDIAVVSDSGTPGVSDPGGELIEAMYEAGISVSPIPGACALAAAISVAGMRGRTFHFLGFAPRKNGERKRLFEKYIEEKETIVLYESPFRVVHTLQSAFEVLGDRRVTVCREMTKKFEEILSVPLSSAIEKFSSKEPKGEFVIVIEGSV